MRKYYTRPCNFYYGNYARKLINENKALPLTGKLNIAFDQVEIINREKKKIIKSNYFHINDIKSFNKNILAVVSKDLKKITEKRKNILGLNFKNSQIMGILNITPDSFSDGGLYFHESKAYEHALLMIKSGVSIIDIGGESTRPGSKTISQEHEWKRVKNTIINIKKNFLKTFISLDTRKSYLMRNGIKNGVDIINDVSGLKFDKKSFDVIKKKKKHLILNYFK